MSFNGSGTFSIGSDGYPVEYNDIGTETFINNVLTELSAGLSLTICRDGQSTISQNLPFNTKRITNLGNATGIKDALNVYGAMTSTATYLTVVGGTANAITATSIFTDELTAYVEGMQFWFKPSAANTGATTIDIQSLGAKDITKCGTIALAAGDLQANEIACIVYDGTRFQLVSPYYAEGSWTPSVGGDATYTTQTGRFTKIGRAVHIVGQLTINVLGTGSTSVISGLPYTAANLINQAVAVSDFASLATNVVWIGARVNTNATTITLRNLTAAGASATSSALFGNSAAVTIAGTYMI